MTVGDLFCALVRIGVENLEGTESHSGFLDQLEEMIRRQTQVEKVAALALAKGADAAAVTVILRGGGGERSITE